LEIDLIYLKKIIMKIKKLGKLIIIFLQKIIIKFFFLANLLKKQKM